MTQAASQHSVLVTQLTSQRLDLMTELMEASAALRAGRPAPEPLGGPGGLGAAVWRGPRRGGVSSEVRSHRGNK